MISEKDIQDFAEAEAVYFDKANKIEQRITEVMLIIWDCFKMEQTFWVHGDASYEDDTDEGSLNSKEFIKEDGLISIQQGGPSLKLLMEKWDYSQSFPRSFLLMEDDEIRKILLSEIAETEQKSIERKEKAKLARQKSKKNEELKKECLRKNGFRV